MAGIKKAGYTWVSTAQSMLPTLCAEPAQNMVMQEPSGSGKTVAMAILMLNRVNTQKHVPQILCVTGSIELTVQLSQKMLQLGSYMPDLRIRKIVQGGECKLLNLITFKCIAYRYSSN